MYQARAVADFAVPPQERGVRPARAVPYELQAIGEADAGSGKVKIHFVNTGNAAAVFQVRSGNDADGPWTYTVGAGDDLTERWSFRASHETACDLTVYGPNGFLRAFKGGLDSHSANVVVKTSYDPAGNALTLQIENQGGALANLRIVSAYGGEREVHFVAAGGSLDDPPPLVVRGEFGWAQVRLHSEGSVHAEFQTRIS